MADRNAKEIYAHHKRLADNLASVRIREDYPTLARYPELVDGVIAVAEHEEWRKNRCFDHFEVMGGARTPDGKSGYTLCFYGTSDDAFSPVSRVTLTEPELDELMDAMAKARGPRD